jgi:hypothetical protein
MSVSRFSLRKLLVATACVAVVITALVSSSRLWADAIFSATIAFCLVAALAAFFCVNHITRDFWRGFCVIAWAYLFLTFGPWSVGQVRSHLITDQLLRPIQRWLAPLQAARYVEPGFQLRQTSENSYQTGPNSRYSVWGGDWQATQRIGHSVWTILLGVIGGYLAVYFSKSGTNQPTAA